jgi:hypothetical protein
MSVGIMCGARYVFPGRHALRRRRFARIHRSVARDAQKRGVPSFQHIVKNRRPTDAGFVRSCRSAEAELKGMACVDALKTLLEQRRKPAGWKDRTLP